MYLYIWIYNYDTINTLHEYMGMSKEHRKQLKELPSLIIEKKRERDKFQFCIFYKIQVYFKTVNVIKSKENLRNCQNLRGT